MAVYKLFPTQDATLYSNFSVMNTGLDAILEVSNQLGLDGNPDVARYLIQFDNNEIQDIIDNKINGNSYNIYLKNFIAEAQGINQSTLLEIHATAQEWNNGTGYYGDSPSVKDGVSWEYTLYSGSGAWSMNGSNTGGTYTGSYNSTYSSQGGGNWYTSSAYLITESFSLRNVKDIEIDTTSIVDAWYDSTLPNYGFLVKLTSSLEFNPSQFVQPIFKFYSVDTNTIYPPTLEFRWRDYDSSGFNPSKVVTTSNIKLSLAENPGIFYPESINRFYINVSPLYPARVYQTSSLYTNLNYLPIESYYAVKDLDTNEYVINFDDNYTQISADSTGNYFDIYMSGLEPERYYKILIKTTIQGSTIIYDDSYYFKVING